MEIKDRDGNVFNGTPEELKKFFGKTTDLSKSITTTVSKPLTSKSAPIPTYDGKLQADLQGDFIPLDKKTRGPYTKKKTSRKNQRWTREEDLRVIGFFNDKSNRFSNGHFKRSALLSFASRLGRSKKSLYIRLRTLGLSLKP